MNILVTNDDGIFSPGLWILAESLNVLGEVTIVAPDSEMSAVGHSITINNPLRVKEVKKGGKLFGYAVNGTPADCVKIALGAIMKQRPDLVIAGINEGLNIGTNIMYSGTVSGAMEGAILGLPSIAISVDVDKDMAKSKSYEEIFSLPAEFSLFLAKMVVEKGLPDRTLLNCNFPSCGKGEIKGILITRQGQTRFIDRFQKRLDPRHNVYYWLEGEDIELEGGDGLDFTAVKKDFISITPLYSDLTNHRYIEELEDWDLSGKF